MKIAVDGKELFELSEIQEKVIMNDIHEDEFYPDMCRRLRYILMHKYEQCFARMKAEWDEKLKGRVDAVPLDPDKYAELVFAQPDYMNRKAREIL
jgi:hypothetical protein